VSKDSSVSSALRYVYAVLNIFVRILACLNQSLTSMPMLHRQSKCIRHPDPYTRRKTYIRPYIRIILFGFNCDYFEAAVLTDSQSR
jgi:hypothetical protein